MLDRPNEFDIRPYLAGIGLAMAYLVGDDPWCDAFGPRDDAPLAWQNALRARPRTQGLRRVLGLRSQADDAPGSTYA